MFFKGKKIASSAKLDKLLALVPFGSLNPLILALYNYSLIAVPSMCRSGVFAPIACQLLDVE